MTSDDSYTFHATAPAVEDCVELRRAPGHAAGPTGVRLSPRVAPGDGAVTDR